MLVLGGIPKKVIEEEFVNWVLSLLLWLCILSGFLCRFVFFRFNWLQNKRMSEFSKTVGKVWQKEKETKDPGGKSPWVNMVKSQLPDRTLYAVQTVCTHPPVMNPDPFFLWSPFLWMSQPRERGIKTSSLIMQSTRNHCKSGIQNGFKHMQQIYWKDIC